jgi:gamma-tubulin complex component 2
MLNFLQSYLYYVTSEVIDPNWDKMSAHLDGARTVDELIAIHDGFLETCMRDSMLFWPKILKRLDRIRAACARFAVDSQRFAARALRAMEESKKDMDTARLQELDEEIYDVMSDIESQYAHLLRDLLNALKDSDNVETNLNSLCSRLDFNDFFSASGREGFE